MFEGGGRGAVDILDGDCIQFRKSLGENSQLFEVKSSVCNTPCYSVLCEPGFVFLTVFFLSFLPVLIFLFLEILPFVSLPCLLAPESRFGLKRAVGGHLDGSVG